MKITKSTFLLTGIVLVGNLFFGCLKGEPTRPANDLEAIYKCKLGVHPESCEKDNLFILGAVALASQQPAAGGGTSTFSIGGTITGLTAAGLVLQNNTGDDLTVASGATSFTFATKVSGAYSVTVKTQPTGLACTVSSGSGTATADVSNVTVSCANSCSNITRPWGTFTDCKDGTVKLEVTAGTFGGQTYTAQTLFYAKCSHGQTYDASGNTCSATETATKVQYCSPADNSCNGGTNGGTLNGSGTSGAYTACNGLSLAGKTWRVPTKDELKLLINCNTETEMPNDGSQCSASTPPTVNNLFPNSLSDIYWSSSAGSLFSDSAWVVPFNTGRAATTSKTNNNYVRCISGP